MNTRTRNPRGPAFAMPTSHEVTVRSPRRENVCRVPGCERLMIPRTWDDGTRYSECPNPEHPDTLREAWNERAGHLEQDAPAVFDVQGRL